MDQARKKEVGQFDKHSEVGDFGDDGFKSLTRIGAGLHFKVFQELEFF